jgi:hypothetical protein
MAVGKIGLLTTAGLSSWRSVGWSNPAMAARYAHLVAPLRQDIATRVGGLIWADKHSAEVPSAAVPDGPTETKTETMANSAGSVRSG